MPKPTDPDRLAQSLLAGNRRDLARTITLIESTRADQRAIAHDVLERCAAARSDRDSPADGFRIGITGIPGVGKSTFIETAGLLAVERGHKVAVLAVDPTSARSGGSVLGDKTRMERLARRDEAFIRPSPTGGTLGGVARRTRESILACECAGYDWVIVETVGVGQSETAVADMVDAFLLLLMPGSGDDLQGIKRGIVEMADILVVNKADGELAAAAGRAVTDYRHALAFLAPRDDGWKVPVLACSALEKLGFDAVFEALHAFRENRHGAGLFQESRRRQALAWMWSDVRETLIERFTHNPTVRARVEAVEAEVGAGTMTPARAADALVDAFLGSTGAKGTCE